MDPKNLNGKEEIFSKVMRAGRRTYFFDVRATRADDYYLTITESKKQVGPDGQEQYKKHKLYLYKEDFSQFCEILEEVTDYIVSRKGTEVISDTHDPNYNATHPEVSENGAEADEKVKQFSDIKFEDI